VGFTLKIPDEKAGMSPSKQVSDDPCHGKFMGGRDKRTRTGMADKDSQENEDHRASEKTASLL
jgi:hypothetical protein